MICGRTYLPTGPYFLHPHGELSTTHLCRVVDRMGRRISVPMKRKEALRLCLLLNDVYESAVATKIKLTLSL